MGVLRGETKLPFIKKDWNPLYTKYYTDLIIYVINKKYTKHLDTDDACQIEINVHWILFILNITSK